MIALIGAAAHGYLDGPTWSGRRFLRACSARNYGELYQLFDDSYRASLSPRASEELLKALHRFVPRSYRIVMSGRPNMYGFISDWKRYNIRVAFQEPVEALREHKSFVITLVQGEHGEWRVEFGSTYRSLFFGLYGDRGEEFLRRVFWSRGRTPSTRFAGTREQRRLLVGAPTQAAGSRGAAAGYPRSGWRPDRGRPPARTVSSPARTIRAR